MKQLILLVGPPGSGKSTYRICPAIKDKYTVISQDDQGKKEHLILFKEAMSEGKDIVVDRMGFSVGQRNRYLDPARKAGYDIKIVVFHVPLEEYLKRCNERENHPTIKDPKTASKAINFFFKNYERVEDSEANEVVRMGWDKRDKKECIWVDIDGTMANIEHRRHFTHRDKEAGIKPHWGKFFSEMVSDTLNQWCADITQMFAINGTPIVFATGRPSDYHKQTLDWLNEHKLMHDHLFMRARGDFRKDNIVKEIILEFEIKTRYSVKFAIDDRKQVVDMLRAHDVVVLQCDFGDF